MIRKLIPSLALAFLMLQFSSCDEVESPLVPPSELDWSLYPDEDIDTYPWPVWTTNENTEINVLLEDYTGHKCTPCVLAAIVANNLEEADPEHVFVASVHASPTGLFQATDAEHPNDLTIEAGIEYSTIMPGFEGNPSGATNRLPVIPNDNVWQPSSQWGLNINEVLAEDLKVNLQMQYNYYPSTNGLFVHTEVQFLEEVTGQVNLIHFLIRKEVVSAQTLPGGTVFEDYEHHQVVSGVIGGTWGENVSSDLSAAGTTTYIDLTYQLPDPLVDPTYAQENLAVFSFVLDRDSYKILQVIRTDIE